MKHITFEEYLQKKYAENIDEGSRNGHELQENYERWIENKEAGQIFALAEGYGRMLTAIKAIEN